ERGTRRTFLQLTLPGTLIGFQASSPVYGIISTGGKEHNRTG
ncbi:unnamed protein product, partial [Tenebrio molitor]